MVEVSLDGKKLAGRLISEDDQQVRVEPFGAGVIGYRKANLAGVRRFTLSRGSYYEQYGDYYRDHAWKAEDAPGEFINARLAYEKAYVYAESSESRARLGAKVQAVSADREEWQREAARKAELEKLHQEAELAKVQRELTAEKLAAFQRQDLIIRDLQIALRDAQQRLGFLANALADADRRIADIQRDLEGMDRLEAVFVTNAVFLDLKREHMALQREVDRLGRSMQR